jgi:hypothetical protein
MPAPTPADHHSRSAKINHSVLARAAWRVTIKLWPLVALFLLAKIYVNLSDEEPFSFVDDIVFALWPTLFFAGLFFALLLLVLSLGTKLKMKQAQANPGPGKPPRGPKDPS